LDAFYMERNSKSNPVDSHIVGLTLQIKITHDTQRRGVPHEEN
jgi:hypothetical protein